MPLINVKECPCKQFNKPFESCCGPYLLEEASPKRPRLLMASRYTAYVIQDWDYIQKTQSGLATIRFNLEAAKAQQVNWMGLTIFSETMSSCLTKADVIFEARYLHMSVEAVLKEKSQFRYECERWFYTNSI